jgi:hypothetical protein
MEELAEGRVIRDEPGAHMALASPCARQLALWQRGSFKMALRIPKSNHNEPPNPAFRLLLFPRHNAVQATNGNDPSLKAR